MKISIPLWFQFAYVLLWGPLNVAKCPELPCSGGETQAFLSNASLNQVRLHVADSLEFAHSMMWSTLHLPLFHSLLPASHPWCVLCPSIASGHFGTCPYSVFQMMVGERSADGAGQGQVLLRKGHAILRSAQESQPSLVCWETHLTFPSSFPAWGLFWHPCWSIAALLCNEVNLSPLGPVPSPPIPSFTSLPPEPWASAHPDDSPRLPLLVTSL